MLNPPLPFVVVSVEDEEVLPLALVPATFCAIDEIALLEVADDMAVEEVREVVELVALASVVILT